MQHLSIHPPFPEIDGVSFRLIPDLFGYAASDDGVIWTCRRNRSLGYGRGTVPGIGRDWKRMNTYVGRMGIGYQCLKIQRKTKMVHRLVAAAFLGPCPDGLQVCHSNGNSHDNRLENLRYDTPSNNQADKFQHNGVIMGERSPMSKLTADDVREIREVYRKGCAINGGEALSRRFGVDSALISRIIKRRSWKHIV